MKEGIIIKGYGGFYFVLVDDFLWECTLRGKYRIKDQEFLVGDQVLITPIDEKKAVIEKVIKRENQLQRPPVANVEQVIIVLSFASPAPDFNLLDRLLILTEFEDLDALICFNKKDLITNGSAKEILKTYKNIGYKALGVSAITKENIHLIKENTKNKISVLAGPSGAGKSSLLNAIQPGLSLKTGSVSEKTQRGRHTTRHVELLQLDYGGFVADTPGFSRVTLPDIGREELAYYFPEIAKVGENCRFTSCLHQGELGCAIETSLEAGEIDAERYRNYLYFLNELTERERRY